MYYSHVEVGHGAKGRIGIKYDPVKHKIVTVYHNTPAEEAGLLPGDIVKHINDKDIKGPSYTKVNLTIKRGNVIFTVEIERVPCEQVLEDDKKNNQEAPQVPIDTTIKPETA